MSYKVTKGDAPALERGADSEKSSFQTFEDLEVYKSAREFRKVMHGRFHYPDQIRFILHSRGSLEELVDDLNVCLDEKYLPSDEVAKLKEQARCALILINGYLRYLRSHSSSVRETDGEAPTTIDSLEDLPL